MKLLYKMKENLFLRFLQLVFVWVHLALGFEVFMLITNYTNPKLNTKVGNYLTWKFDGRFKNLPENVWYEKTK